MLLDGAVYPESFGEHALAEERRHALAPRRHPRARTWRAPIVRGARVAVTLRDGTVRRAR
jgi:hypothetical protein